MTKKQVSVIPKKDYQKAKIKPQEFEVVQLSDDEIQLNYGTKEAVQAIASGFNDKALDHIYIGDYGNGKYTIQIPLKYISTIQVL